MTNVLNPWRLIKVCKLYHCFESMCYIDAKVNLGENASSSGWFELWILKEINVSMIINM